MSVKLFKKIALLILCVFTIWLIGYGCFIASVLSMKPEQPEKVTDAIVVLTGGSMRIETGLELFAKGQANDLFITGVHPQVGQHDIEQKWQGEPPLPSCCIILGHSAETTVQNANETGEWLLDKNYKSIRLVTADFHMKRALIEFGSILPELEIIPHPIVQPNITIDRQRFWVLTFAEYHKTIFRWASLLLSHNQLRPESVQ